jgi:DNA modification methylase
MTLTPYYDDGTVALYCVDVADTDGQALALEGQAAAVVTSPPYNVGLGYDCDPSGDALDWSAYRHLATTATTLTAAVLVPGGRAWVNTAVSVPAHPGSPTGEGKRRVLLAHLWASELATAGLRLVDQVSWQSVRGPGTAWGSWQSPASPNLRGDHELVTVACNGPWERRPPVGLEGWRDTVGGWQALCSTVWKVCTVSNGRNTDGRRDHPAPFPTELARRCIRLSTWPGEVVFDPFAGTGTTLLAARQLSRRAVGVERSERYCALAVERLAQGALDLGGAA